MAAERPAEKGSAKYVAQVWSGLIDDPACLAKERARRAKATLAVRTRELGAKQAEAMGRADAAAGLMGEAG
jgi:hypothetical protein